MNEETREAVREAADRAQLSDGAWVRELIEDTLTSTSNMDQFIDELADAFLNEGANPEWHRKVLHRHESEWPTLHKAIRKIVMTRVRERAI